MILQIEPVLHTEDPVINWIIGILVVLVGALFHRYEKKITENQEACIARHAESTAEISINRSEINKLHEKIEGIRIEERAELTAIIIENTKSLSEISRVIESFKKFIEH